MSTGPASSRVFVVYDEGMLAHAHIPHLQKKHPEKPSRLTTIHTLLDELGLLQQCDCTSIKPRSATDEEILSAHTREHLEEVRRISMEVAGEPNNRELREPDGPGGIYYSPESLRTGLLAAGCVIEASRVLLRLTAEEAAEDAAAQERLRVVQTDGARTDGREPEELEGPLAADAKRASGVAGDGGHGEEERRARARARPALNAIALVRPPGHHAGEDDTPGHRAEGFCFFNNVACAAAAVLAQGLAQRVLVLDYDVHHGNGTQAIFSESASVLYMSIHRLTRGFYPQSGALTDCGSGAGLGFTLNLPWLQTGLGDPDYLAVCQLLLLPIARDFDPQLVLVSAGFDAAEGDVQGGMRLSPWGFAQMTAAIAGLGRPTVHALEGGYNQPVTAKCMAEVVRVLLDGAPALDWLELAACAPVSHHAEAQLRAAIAVQRTHWPRALGSEAHAALVEDFFERSRRHAQTRRASPRVQLANCSRAGAQPQPRPAASSGTPGAAKKRGMAGGEAS